MKRLSSLYIILAIIVFTASAYGQETVFGKNKVQYREFDWQYIQTEHFDVYFYDNQYDLAKFAGQSLEKAYDIVSDQFDYYIKRRVPVFLYSSPGDFQQTNVTNSILDEGIGGFTEAFKNRIVIPFTGSYEDLRHVLHHELVHAVTYDLIYGQLFKTLLSRQRLFSLPLWFAEGSAEYSSRGGWDYWADMVVRDATINGYLAPPDYLGGYLAYKEGQAMVKYIVDHFGIEKLGEILVRGKSLITMDRALKSSIGMTSEELYEKFAKEMKKRYWPEISKREEPKEFAKQLTDHTKDGSNFNEKPVYSPTGQVIAVFSDRKDYTEIYLLSAIDGRVIDRLVKGERSSDLESLHWYTSGMSFSPDGKNLVFVSKSGGEDALRFLRLKDKNIYAKKKFGLNSIISPAWSPDGNLVAFTALERDRRDIYLYHIDTDSLERLTNDRYDQMDVTWFPSGEKIAFSSDLPHPSDYSVMPDSFVYGRYNLFEMTLADKKIDPIFVGPGQNSQPAISPDGDKICFVSNRNGIDNLYIYYIDSARVQAVTDILSNAASPSWSPDGKHITFSSYSRGGFDVYVMNEINAKGENGILAPTDFAQGKYYNPVEWAGKDEWSRTKEFAEKEQVKETKSAADPDFPAGASEGSEQWTEQSGVPSPEGQSKDESGEPSTATSPEANASPDTTATQQNGQNTETAGQQLTGQGSEESGTESDTVAVKPSAQGEESGKATSGEEGEKKGTETAQKGEEKTSGESGTIDKKTGDYVYTSDEEDSLSVYEEQGELSYGDEGGEQEEGKRHVDLLAQKADSINNTDSSGEYIVRNYKTKFTPDLIAGGLQYDTFFGFRGQSFFVFSDYLGDHQIYIATDLVNTIDQSNVQVYYFYRKLRVDFGVGIFHTKNYYIDANDELFSDRFYGAHAFMSWPRSKFTRLEAGGAIFLIDRKFYDRPDQPTRSDRLATGQLSWVHDTVIWGVTGPINGRRYRLTLEGSAPLSEGALDYYSAELDYRRYFHFRPFSFGVRLSGGISEGGNPKNFYLGGTTNRIGYVDVDNSVYNIKNLYFSRVVTPLRGYDYYDLVGTRYWVTNWELRFPFVDYFKMRYPLSLTLTRLTGALFLDMGAAWTEESGFKGATSQGGTRLVDIKSGFGFGIRANLGFLVLRYDAAWRTNFNTIDSDMKHYFSLGAEF
jgi:Tol biopolymer transport system component